MLEGENVDDYAVMRAIFTKGVLISAIISKQARAGQQNSRACSCRFCHDIDKSVGDKMNWIVECCQSLFRVRGRRHYRVGVECGDGTMKNGK
jgi:hypothetical protein